MRVFKSNCPLWDDSIWLLIGEAGHDGKLTAYVSSMTLTERKQPYELIHDPSMRLDAREAKNLMDALWSVGVRPSSGEGNTGQLGAMEKHLEDMRRLVFKGPE